MKKLLMFVILVGLISPVLAEDVIAKPKDPTKTETELLEEAIKINREKKKKKVIVEEEIEVRGVKPADNVTTLEFNPGVEVIDDNDGISSSYFKAKLNYSFNKKYSVGVVLPIKRFQGNGIGRNGLGDASVDFSYVDQIKDNTPWNFGVGVDMGLPTATKTELGLGHFEVHPHVFVEYDLPAGFYLAGGARYYRSFLGNSNRPDTEMFRFRGNFGYVATDDIFWAIFDPHFYIDLENRNKEFYIELEAGFMFRKNVAIYAKPGFHVSGGRRSNDWALQIGITLLDLDYF